MQEVFELVAVRIELTVEVLGDKPVGLKQFFGAGKTEGAEQQAFKFIVGDSVFFTGTDVEEVVPEIPTEVACGIFGNQVAKQTAGIFHRAPFQNAVNRHMEHNRVHIFQNVGIQNTGLTHDNPVFKPAFDEYAFRNRLGNGVVVVNGNFNRVTATAPVNRVIAVAGFSNCADIANFHSVGVGLCQNRFADVLRSADVGFLCSVRFPVRSGRNHAADVQDVICAGYRGKHVFIVAEIAPDDLERRVVHIRRKFVVVLFAVAQQNHDVKLISFCKQFFKAGKAHVTGSACKHNSFLFSHFLPPQNS